MLEPSDLPRILLHTACVAALPATGQRRDILLKCLRRIQISPLQSADFQLSPDAAHPPVQITIAAGFAISWIVDCEQSQPEIHILDIRGQ